MTDELQQVLPSIMQFLRENAIGILVSIGIFILMERVISLLANHYVQEDERRHEIKKWSRYFILVFFVIWLVLLYYTYAEKNMPFFLFILGLLLAAIAISLRDIFSNIAGWVIIMSGRGYRARDRVKIGSIIGDVIDIGILRTTLAEIGEWVKADQSTGRLVTIPNNMVLSNPVSNYTQGFDFVWDEFSLNITFESEWSRAEEIMLDVAMKDFEDKKDQILERIKMVKKKYLLRYNVVSPKVYITIGDSGVCLTLRYMVRTRRRRTMQDSFSREILARFATEPRVELAYPTMRLYRMGESPAPDTGQRASE